MFVMLHTSCLTGSISGHNVVCHQLVPAGTHNRILDNSLNMHAIFHHPDGYMHQF